MSLLVSSSKLESMFSELDIIDESEIDDYCHICKEKHNNNSCKLPCGHNYHYNCLRDSLKKSADKTYACPLCKQNYGTLSLVRNNKLFPKEKKIRKKDVKVEISLCKGITKKGLPCKNHGKHNGYCHLHIPKDL